MTYGLAYGLSSYGPPPSSDPGARGRRLRDRYFEPWEVVRATISRALSPRRVPTVSTQTMPGRRPLPALDSSSSNRQPRDGRACRSPTLPSRAVLRTRQDRHDERRRPVRGRPGSSRLLVQIHDELFLRSPGRAAAPRGDRSRQDGDARGASPSASMLLSASAFQTCGSLTGETTRRTPRKVSPPVTFAVKGC